MTHQPATINRLPARNRALKLVAWSLPLVAGLAMALAAHAQGVPSVGQVVFVSGPAQLVTASGFIDLMQGTQDPLHA